MRRLRHSIVAVALWLGSTPALRAADILTFTIDQRWQNRIIRQFDEHRVTEIGHEAIPTVDFRDYHVVYLTDNHGETETPAYAAALARRAADIEAYLRGGGRLIVGVQAYGGKSTANGDEYAFLPAVLVRGLEPGVTLFGDFVRHAVPDHPLFRPFPNEENCGVHDLCLSNWGSSYHGALPTGLLPVLAIDDARPPFPLIRGGRVDAGRILVWTLDPDQHNTPAARALVRSGLDWVLCSDSESLEAECRDEQERIVVEAEARGGLEGASVIFRLNGGLERITRFDKDGLAAATWFDVEPGPRTVEAELSCGDVLSRLVDCPVNRCTGLESLKAVCNATNRGTEFRAVLKDGYPLSRVVFELDGGMPMEVVVGDNGRAVALWLNVAPGRHVTRVFLACGDRLRAKAKCP